jgi:hypothetical protein
MDPDCPERDRFGRGHLVSVRFRRPLPYRVRREVRGRVCEWADGRLRNDIGKPSWNGSKTGLVVNRSARIVDEEPPDGKKIPEKTEGQGLRERLGCR